MNFIIDATGDVGSIHGNCGESCGHSLELTEKTAGSIVFQ